MKRLLALGLAMLLVIAFASPAFAVNGSQGAGRAFGQHHAEHARDMGGFTGAMNPGVLHQGFSGYDEHHEH